MTLEHDQYIEHINTVCKHLSAENLSLDEHQIKNIYESIDTRVEQSQVSQKVNACKPNILQLIESKVDQYKQHRKEQERSSKSKSSRVLKHLLSEQFEATPTFERQISQERTKDAIEYKESGKLVSDIINILSNR